MYQIQKTPISLNSFFGISEDDNIMNEGQILYQEGIDLETNKSYITLQRKPKNYISPLTAPVISSAALSYTDLEATIFCTDDGKIYYNTDLVFDNDEIRFFKIIQYADYVLFIDRNAHFYKISKENLDEEDWDTFLVLVDNDVGTGAAQRPLPISEYPVFCTPDSFGLLWLGYDTFIGLYDTSIDALTWVLQYNIKDLKAPIVALEEKGEQIYLFLRNGDVGVWQNWETIEESAYVDAYKLGITIDAIQRIGWLLYAVSGDTLYEIGDSVNVLYNASLSDVLGGDKVKIRDKRVNWVIQGTAERLFLMWGVKRPLTIENFEFNKAGVMSFWRIKSISSRELNMLTGVNSTWVNLLGVYNILYATHRTENPNGIDDDAVEKRIYFAYKTSNGTYGIDYIDLSENDAYTQDNWVIILPNLTFLSNIGEKILESVEILVDFGEYEEHEGEIQLFTIKNGEISYLQVNDGSWFIANKEISTLTPEGLDELDENRWSDKVMIKSVILNRRLYDLSLGLYIKHKNTVRRSQGIKIYWVRLNLWLEQQVW